MSLNHTEMVECPRCREKSSFTVWTSLNTETDPEKKEEVLSGKIFFSVVPIAERRRMFFFPCCITIRSTLLWSGLYPTAGKGKPICRRI